jgi:hypothetical protein
MIYEMSAQEASATSPPNYRGEPVRPARTTGSSGSSGSSGSYYYSEVNRGRGSSGSVKSTARKSKHEFAVANLSSEKVTVRRDASAKLRLLREEILRGAGESPSSSPSFYFMLEGEYAKGDVVKCGSDVDLTFNYAVPEDVVLAIIKGQGLKDVVEKNLDLTISIIPKGFSFRDDTWWRVAQFRDGKLKDPVRFFLRASNKETPDAGFYFTFEVNGYSIYQFHLPVKLVKSVIEFEAPPSAARRSLDLDLHQIIREKETAEEAMASI